MSWAVAAAVGFALGGVHLLLFVRGFGALLGGKDGAWASRAWAVLGAGRFLLTLVLAAGLTRALGLAPEGVAGGLIAAFTAWKAAAVWKMRSEDSRGRGAATTDERASLA